MNAKPKQAHLLRAYNLGYSAASLGQPCQSPYPDKRQAGSLRVTYSLAYINAWHLGWRDYHLGGAPTQAQLI